MKTITVLMSTYNGEKYMREQIESVLAQKDVKIVLVVRDDGSSDSTKDILLEYEKKGKLYVIFGENIGWRKSFMDLVYNAPKSDYYAFCDQDDIWLPEKLSIAINVLEKESVPNKPLLYGSNLYYYRNGEKEGKLNLNPNFTKQSILVRTLTCGCTLVFNQTLHSLLKQNRPQYVEAHDSWVFMTALYFGKIIYDPNAYILYRQHENNQIGAKVSLKERFKRGIKTAKRLGKDQSKRLAAEEFLRIFNNQLTENDKRIILKFANYPKSIMSKIKLLFDNRYSMGGGLSDIFLKFKIITNTI